MDQLNAGSLFVEVGASTSKLDADLAKAKKALDAFEAEDPTVAILAELSEKGETDTEQELKRLVSRLEQQTELEIDVSVDKNGEIPGAGKQIELFQSKLSKVLGIAAGLTAGVALFGGIAKGAKDAGQLTGVLADQTKRAEGGFRTFSASIPVIGQLGIAISDLGMALGIVEDGARKAALAAAEMAEALRLEGVEKTLRRLGQDLDKMIFELSNLDISGTAELDAQLFEQGLDPIQRQLEDQRQQLIDAARANEEQLRKFGTDPAETGRPTFFDVPEDQEQIFQDLIAEEKRLREEFFAFERKERQILELRQQQLQNARLEEEMKKQQEIAAADQAAIDEAARLQAEEDAAFDKRMQERNENRMRGFEVQKEMLEDAKRLEERRLAIMQRMALAQAGINKSTIEALKKERDEIKKAGAERASTRRSLGETQAIDTAIGSFTIGRSFSPGDTVANIEEQTKKSVESIDKKIDGLEKIFKRIETKLGGSNGAFT